MKLPHPCQQSFADFLHWIICRMVFDQLPIGDPPVPMSEPLPNISIETRLGAKKSLRRLATLVAESHLHLRVLIVDNDPPISLLQTMLLDVAREAALMYEYGLTHLIDQKCLGDISRLGTYGALQVIHFLAASSEEVLRWEDTLIAFLCGDAAWGNRDLADKPLESYKMGQLTVEDFFLRGFIRNTVDGTLWFVAGSEEERREGGEASINKSPSRRSKSPTKAPTRGSDADGGRWRESPRRARVADKYVRSRASSVGDSGEDMSSVGGRSRATADSPSPQRRPKVEGERKGVRDRRDNRWLGEGRRLSTRVGSRLSSRGQTPLTPLVPHASPFGSNHIGYTNFTGEVFEVLRGAVPLRQVHDTNLERDFNLAHGEMSLAVGKSEIQSYLDYIRGEKVPGSLNDYIGSAAICRADLTGMNLSGGNFTGTDFRCARLDRANVEGALFFGCNFYGAKMRDMRAADSFWDGACMDLAELQYGDFAAARMVKCDLSFTNMFAAQRDGWDCTGARIQSALGIGSHSPDDPNFVAALLFSVWDSEPQNQDRAVEVLIRKLFSSAITGHSRGDLCSDETVSAIKYVFHRLPVPARTSYARKISSYPPLLAAYSTLKDEPDPDGRRISVTEGNRLWLMLLDELFLPQSQAFGGMRSVLSNFGERYLKIEISDQILDPATQTFPTDSASLPIFLRRKIGDPNGPDLTLKMRPEQPGVEGMVGFLIELVAGEGHTRRSELGAFILASGDRNLAVPFQIVENFQERSTAPKDSDEIDGENFTWQFIISYVIAVFQFGPRLTSTGQTFVGGEYRVLREKGGGKLTKRLVLVGLDTAFLAKDRPVAETYRSKIFCLGQMMQIVSRTVLKKITELDPTAVVTAWLENCERENFRYKQVAPTEGTEVGKMYKENVMLPMIFPRELALGIWDRLNGLKSEAARLLSPDSTQWRTTTHLDLLHTLDIDMARNYQRAFAEIPHVALSPRSQSQSTELDLCDEASARRLEIVNRQVESGERKSAWASTEVTASRLRVAYESALRARFGWKEVVETMHGAGLGARAALTELRKYVSGDPQAAVLDELIDGETAALDALDCVPWLRRNLLSKIDFNALPPRTMDKVLARVGIAADPQTTGGGTNMRQLNLGDCRNVTGKLLAGIAQGCGETLTELNLCDVTGKASGLLKDGELAVAVKKMSVLTSLDLSGRNFTELNLKSDSLKRLSVEECRRLKKMFLHCPNLEFISAKACVKLTNFDISISTPNFRRGDFAHCVSLGQERAIEVGMVCVNWGMEEWRLDSDLSALLKKNLIKDSGLIFGDGLMTDLISNPDTVLEISNSGNQFGLRGVRLLGRIFETCSNLVSLNLNGCNIGPEAGLALSETLSLLGNLEGLFLGYNSIGPDAANALGKSVSLLENLRILHLQNNVMSAYGCNQILIGVATLPSLAVLCLDDNIAAEDHEAFSFSKGILLAGLTNLLHLSLAYNNLGPKCCAEICAGLSRFTRMEILCLQNNRMGPDAGSILADALGCLKLLRALHINGNFVGPPTASKIAQRIVEKRRLTLLYIDGEDFAPDILHQVRTRLPKCEIVDANLNPAATKSLRERSWTPKDYQGVILKQHNF